VTRGSDLHSTALRSALLKVSAHLDTVAPHDDNLALRLRFGGLGLAPACRCCRINSRDLHKEMVKGLLHRHRGRDPLTVVSHLGQRSAERGNLCIAAGCRGGTNGRPLIC